jgi:hypothetical protein
MGTSAKHNTFEAEAVGAILALWVLDNTPASAGKRVTLYTDNQSIAATLPYPKATSGQYLLSALRSAIEGTGCRLTIRWISAHSKVKGNEEADRVAKNAAEGRSSARVNLPQILRSPLPTSASALKQDFMQELKSRWAAMWETSPRKQRVDRFGDEFPFTALLKRLSSLTRSQSSQILQIRCGHFPLNSYLHKIKKVDSDRCLACFDDRDDEGRPYPETINHFIFDCTAHTAARDELIHKIGRNRFRLADILSNTDRIKALTTYINRTGRFRN